MDFANLIPDGFRRAITIKVVRWGGTLAGGMVAGYIASHSQVLAVLNQACASLNSEDALKAFFGAGAVAALALVSSIKDAKSVNGKVAVAAAAGFEKGQAHALQQAMQEGVEVQASADTTKIAAVADAMQAADKASKEDKATLVAALKDGKF